MLKGSNVSFLYGVKCAQYPAIKNANCCITTVLGEGRKHTGIGNLNMLDRKTVGNTTPNLIVFCGVRVGEI